MAATALASNYGCELSNRAELRAMIEAKSLRRDGPFTLASGALSSFLFNMKKTMLDPHGANLIADAILDLPEIKAADAIGGLVMGAVPIISVVCAKSLYTKKSIPGFFVRKEPKAHGTRELIDGYLDSGWNVVLIDDVTTTGGSTMKAVRAARDLGCIVNTVVTVVDREEGARTNLANEGVRLISLYTREDFNL